MSRKLFKISVVFLGLVLGSTYLGCGSGGGGGGSTEPNLVFVTSVSGNGNLGTWPDAGGETGLAAADAICQARAGAAGLSGTFIAWLSDETDDAYCRIHGLTGKKTADCGQSMLPDSAGPWVRMDGTGFTESVVQMEAGVIYAPVRYDEFGSQVDADTVFFTATNFEGVLDTGTYGTCSAWASTDRTWVGNGNPNATTFWWTSYGGVLCPDDRPLLCMQIDGGGQMPAYSFTGRTVFVTSVGGSGDLGSWSQAGTQTGIAAGDAICSSLANDAGLANTTEYVAWLSDDTLDAKDRLDSNGPWVRPDGVKVADDLADLINGDLFAPINVKETGGYDGASGTWTGTDSTGNGTGMNCGNWSSSAGSVTHGSAVNANYEWTARAFYSICASGFKLYCFED